jgi:hypothetical protein
MSTTIHDKLAAVRATIARLVEIAPASELIYRPAALQDLTALEFSQLVAQVPDMRAEVGYNSRYEANGYIDGVFVTVKSAKGTRLVPQATIEDELDAIRANAC